MSTQIITPAEQKLSEATQLQVEATRKAWKATHKGGHRLYFISYKREAKKLACLLLSENPENIEAFLKETPTTRSRKTWGEHLAEFLQD